jgi:hypothetical protein
VTGGSIVGGFDYELQPTEVTIPTEEGVVGIDTAIAMRATYGHESPAVRAQFDAVVQLLAGGKQKQWPNVTPQTAGPAGAGPL